VEGLSCGERHAEDCWSLGGNHGVFLKKEIITELNVPGIVNPLSPGG
jgi:hypothetical protein